MSESISPLSDDGLRRREEILEHALAEAGRRRKRQTLARAGIGCAVVGGVIAVTAMVWPVRVERIRDEELLRELAAANRPAGLAYVDGKAVLMFR